MTETYHIDELQLTHARLVIKNDQITVEINNKSVQYQNSYTAFSIDAENNQLIAPHFKLRLNPKDTKRAENWLMDFFI